ncbi:MAG: phosphoenolpyruvate synthase regulatory protein [Robiginitomaculum sp.]|nr:MAG: phosphoenolpyruvate synthase regulatory protein [Robiginitomaculum sp.]
MTRPDKLGLFLHVHLVSDSTGETLAGVMKATCAQFSNLIPIEHMHTMVRSERQMDQVLASMERAPGLVMFTMVSMSLRDHLLEWCARNSVPCMDVLDPLLKTMSQYLGTPIIHETGAQHARDDSYYRRIDALNYATTNDDGQLGSRLDNADVILLGVSRTSKTPTCVYLANRGVKAANIPVVPGLPLPDELQRKNGPLVIGLTVSPKRLVQIRRNRLLSLNEEHTTSYIDEAEVRKEVVNAKRLYARHHWPVIDVTRRSIEETAAKILSLLQERGESE